MATPRKRRAKSSEPDPQIKRFFLITAAIVLALLVLMYFFAF